MKIAPYVSKLQNSSVYKEFQQKYKDAFLMAGFFVIDFENGQHLRQIDYYIPSQKRVAAFTLDKSVAIQLLKTMDKRTPERLDIKTKTDLDALHGIVTDEMKNRNITQDIKKMIAVIQNIKGKAIWNVNCVLSGMDILKVHVEDTTQTILMMEKISLLEIIKKLPPQAQMQMQPPAQQNQTGEEAQGEVKGKLAQLDKIKEALEKEEAELKKQEESAKSKAKVKKKKTA